MKKPPCEYIVWHGLPVIRKELAKSMIRNFGLNEKEAAKKLDISASAVSQYLNGKRGKPDITDERILKEVDKSARVIINKGHESILTETCRLCKFFSSNKIFPFICENCEEER